MVDTEKDLTVLEQAWLKALVREEDEIKRKQRPKRDTSRKQTLVTPSSRRPTLDHRRSVSDIEAAIIESELPVQTPRRRNVHILPQATQTLIHEQRVSESKLKYDASHLGANWSRWISDARSGGWRDIDSKLRNRWVNLVSRIIDSTYELRQEILTVAGVGMGLDNDIIYRSTSTGANKIAYVVNIMASEDRKYLGAGGNGIAIGTESIGSGRFFIISTSHLSGLEKNGEPMMELRESISRYFQQSPKKNLDLKTSLGAVSDWLGKATVKTYFQSKKS